MWAPSGRAAVAYRVINGVSLAAGEPIGARAAWPEAIGAWLADCSRHGWTPAVLACGNAARPGVPAAAAWTSSSWATRQSSTWPRSRWRAARCAASARRSTGCAGPATHAGRPPAGAAPDVLAEAVRAADAFRDGPVERGFSMALSRFGDPRDGDCLLVLCRDAARAAARGVAVRALGRRRAVARPDARRPDRRQRADRADGGQRGGGGAGARRTPGLAELRGAAVGVRPRRGARRRTGAADLAPACCGPRRGCGRSSRCTGPTPSTSRPGSRAICASRPRATCPGSPSPCSARRRSCRAGRPARGTAHDAAVSGMNLTGVPLILLTGAGSGRGRRGDRAALVPVRPVAIPHPHRRRCC